MICRNLSNYMILCAILTMHCIPVKTALQRQRVTVTAVTVTRCLYITMLFVNDHWFLIKRCLAGENDLVSFCDSYVVVCMNGAVSFFGRSVI